MVEFSYGLRWGVWRSTVAALCLWLGSGGAMAQGDCGDVSRVESGLQRAGVPLDIDPVRAFYAASKGACVWDEISALAMISTIERAGDHGLDPALFHGDELANAETRGWDTEVELLLTDAALKYAEVMARGLTAPPVPREDRAANALPEGEAIDGLSGALARGDVARWLETLPPKAPAYQRLKSALSTYRAIAEAGGWESLPTDMRVRFNKKSPLVADLKRRLAIEGDLARDDEKSVYDDAVRAAVLRFQERNGLRADGKLNAKTIERMNISAAERVAQISLNMERWRVYGRELPKARVEVNAPDATAVLFRDDLPVLKMNAVVGAPGHDTPMLMSTINTVVLNPQWNIPQSIIENEIKPSLKRNRDYLRQNHMYWSNDQLIQEPGPHNALGRIKFEFPNRYSVYLHDTPAQSLFTDPERAQSHGCVRLQRPLDLAVELLQSDPTWTREAIQDAIRDGDTIRVPLPEPISVVISYRTVFVAEDGLVQFRPDIYGLDTQLTLVLAQKVEAMKTAR